LQFTAFVFRPSGNATHFTSDEYATLVNAARRERDFDKRMAMYRQIALFVKDAAFILPVANAVYTFGLRANVHGFARQPTAGSPVLEDITLS
jgi:ABC-type transport system substrate-binding protein